MNEDKTYRQIVLTPRCSHGPKKIIMEVYEDGYTPLDVVAAVTCWVLEDPVALESFRTYINEGEGLGGDVTPDGAVAHLKVVLKLLLALWNSPESMNVHISGSEGWVN